MVTKWKNTKSLKRFFHENRRTALGILMAAAGIVVLTAMSQRVGFLNTKITWCIGVPADALLGAGTVLLMRDFLQRHYRDWVPQDSDFYDEWKVKFRKQQNLILVVALLALFFVLMYFFVQTRIYYGYYYNLAFSYLMAATVVLLFGLIEYTVLRFMFGRLHLLMESAKEVSAKRLAEAVEIERQSLEKAAKSEQLKVDLISNVSHDLKTPLTSMVGYLELLKKEELPEVAADYVEVISDKAEKLKEMIESLFSLAKASSGNIKMTPEIIELNRLVEQIFADLEDRVRSSGLQFVFQLTDEDTRFVTDNLHMYRVCQNLIENALKYSAKGTRVFIKTFAEEDTAAGQRQLCLEITNTAGYLMDFDKEDIVERFARGDKARSSEGNGLGLAIVSTYTSAMGGAFDINIDCDQFKTRLTFPALTDDTDDGTADAAGIAYADAPDVPERPNTAKRPAADGIRK